MQPPGPTAAVSFAVCDALPPGPMHASEKVRASGPLRMTFCDPLICCEPVQLPLAEHEVAFDADHVRVADWPG